MGLPLGNQNVYRLIHKLLYNHIDTDTTIHSSTKGIDSYLLLHTHADMTHTNAIIFTCTHQLHKLPSLY